MKKRKVLDSLIVSSFVLVGAAVFAAPHLIVHARVVGAERPWPHHGQPLNTTQAKQWNSEISAAWYAGGGTEETAKFQASLKKYGKANWQKLYKGDFDADDPLGLDISPYLIDTKTGAKKPNPGFGSPRGYSLCGTSEWYNPMGATPSPKYCSVGGGSDDGPGKGDCASHDHTGASGNGGGGDDKIVAANSSMTSFKVTKGLWSGVDVTGTLTLRSAESDDPVQYLMSRSFTEKLERQSGSNWETVTSKAVVLNTGRGHYRVVFTTAPLTPGAHYRVVVSVPSEGFTITSNVAP